MTPTTMKDKLLGWVFVGMMIVGVRAFFGGEQAGTVRSEDCRTQVHIDESDLMTWYHTFTCTTDAVGMKFCTYVKTSGDAGVCDVAYEYYHFPHVAPPPTPIPPRTPAQIEADRTATRIAGWIMVGVVGAVVGGSVCDGGGDDARKLPC